MKFGPYIHDMLYRKCIPLFVIILYICSMLYIQLKIVGLNHFDLRIDDFIVCF